MLVDANVLLYAVHSTAREHDAAAEWLTEQLNGRRRVGLPWQSLTAFLRIVTHPRAFARPLEPQVAWQQVREWLDAPAAWVPVPGRAHAQLFGDLVVRHGIRGNLVPDARLAALALEHGLEVISTDADFARFDEIRWHNPIR